MFGCGVPTERVETGVGRTDGMMNRRNINGNGKII